MKQHVQNTQHNLEMYIFSWVFVALDDSWLHVFIHVHVNWTKKKKKMQSANSDLLNESWPKQALKSSPSFRLCSKLHVCKMIHQSKKIHFPKRKNKSDWSDWKKKHEEINEQINDQTDWLWVFYKINNK